MSLPHTPIPHPAPAAPRDGRGVSPAGGGDRERPGGHRAAPEPRDQPLVLPIPWGWHSVPPPHRAIPRDPGTSSPTAPSPEPHQGSHPALGLQGSPAASGAATAGHRCGHRAGTAQMCSVPGEGTAPVPGPRTRVAQSWGMAAPCPLPTPRSHTPQGYRPPHNHPKSLTSVLHSP